MVFVTEGWWELDKHYSLELCFSNETNLNGLSRGVFSITDRRSGQVETLLNDSDKFAETFTEYTLDLGLSWRLGGDPGKTRFFEIPAKNTFYMLSAIGFFCDYSHVNFSQTARRISIKIKDFKVRLLHYRPALTVTLGKINLSRYSALKWKIFPLIKALREFFTCIHMDISR